MSFQYPARFLQEDRVVDHAGERARGIIIDQRHDFDAASGAIPVAVASAGDLYDAVERCEVANHQVHIDVDAGLHALSAHHQAGLSLLDLIDRGEPIPRRSVPGNEEHRESGLS